MSFASLLKHSFDAWQKDRASQMAAGIAYYALFSIAPILLLLIAFAGIFFETTTVQRQLIGQVGLYVGPQAAQAVAALLVSAHQSSHGGLAVLIGFVIILAGATGFMLSLQDAFNVIWRVETKKTESNLWMIVFKRAVSVLFILVTGILFVASVIVSAALMEFVQVLTVQIHAMTIILPAIDFIVSFLVVLLLFAILFKFLPDVHVDWKDVWIGASFTTLLFVIGKSLLGWYLGSSNAVSAYGAAATIIILLLWVYYSAQILFFGVEMTKVYAEDRHLIVTPRHYAQFAEPPATARRTITFLPDLATIMGFLLIEFQVVKWFLSFRKKWKIGRKFLHR